MSFFTLFEEEEEIRWARKETKRKVVPLYNWCLKIKSTNAGGHLFNNFVLCVRGYLGKNKETDQYWTSSEIVEIKTGRLLLSANTAYYLSGNIDDKTSQTEGFDHSFNRCFKKGFPDEWHQILEAFGNYIVKKQITVLRSKDEPCWIMDKFLLKNKYRTKNLSKDSKPLDWKQSKDKQEDRDRIQEQARKRKLEQEQKRKQDVQKRRREEQKRNADSYNAELNEIYKLSTETGSYFKPIDRSWTSNDVAKLWEIVRDICPCTDKDWNLVCQLFGQGRSLEEVKKQAEPMKSRLVRKRRSSTELVEKFKKLMPDRKLPAVGTMRRLMLEDEIKKIVLCHKAADEHDLLPNDLDDDAEDRWILESLCDRSIDTTLNMSEEYEPVNNIQYSLLASPYRRNGYSRNSLESDVGDDFSIPDRSRQYKAKLRYQLTYIKKAPKDKLFDDEQLSDDSDSFQEDQHPVDQDFIDE